MTNPTPHGQVPEALIDLIDAYAETRHRCGGIYNARTEAARKAVIEALSGVQALSAAPEAIAKLRHLYKNLMCNGVRSTEDAKRIAQGLLAPAIEALERATPPAGQPDLSKLTERGAKAWAGVDAQALRDGTYQAATTTGAALGVEQAAPKAAPGGKFQTRVQPWLLQCFGAEIAADTVERNHRFLEEALELVQSTGCTQSEAHQLVDYAFGRPVGDPAQEVGGVMVTLAALCLANGLDMHNAGEIELARIWTKVEAIRAKQAAKPKHSPLPQSAPQPAPAPLSEREAFESTWENLYGKKPVLWDTVFKEAKMDVPAHSAGKYFYLDARAAWKAWQARAALAAQGGK